MVPQLSETAFLSLLRQVFWSHRCRSLHYPRRPNSQSFQSFHASRTHHVNITSLEQRRPYHQTLSKLRNKNNRSHVTASRDIADIAGELDAGPRKDVAIIGAGITGLVAAHTLALRDTTARVTIYEGSHRTGGWIQSKRVNVGNGHVVFEQAVRSLRPHTHGGKTTVQLIRDLGLTDELLITPKSSPAARNRFVYYPDHLVKIPGAGDDVYSIFWRLITEPAFTGLVTGGLREPFQPERASDIADESIASFLNRRFGSSYPVDNLVSAVLHGIFAGDVYQLSARSLALPRWSDEIRHGSICGGLYERWRTGRETYSYKDLWSMLRSNGIGSDEFRLYFDEHFKDASVYSFKGGIGTLSDALDKSLRANPKVTFKMSTEVKKVEAADDGIQITTSSKQPPSKHTHAISTINGRILSKVANIPALSSLHSVTVMVVNLFYSDPDLLPERGFGYLIPRSIPLEQNPENALGVVFDSESSVGQDTAEGTKVSVMLGGHWWDSFSSYPSEEEGLVMAKAIMERHLKITNEPTAVNVALHKNCIPQYTVGHQARMLQAHKQIEEQFGTRLAVAGASYEGVGLNDCVQSGMITAADLGLVTGLQNFDPDVDMNKVMRGISGFEGKDTKD